MIIWSNPYFFFFSYGLERINVNCDSLNFAKNMTSQLFFFFFTCLDIEQASMVTIIIMSYVWLFGPEIFRVEILFLMHYQKNCANEQFFFYHSTAKMTFSFFFGNSYFHHFLLFFSFLSFVRYGCPKDVFCMLWMSKRCRLYVINV